MKKRKRAKRSGRFLVSDGDGHESIITMCPGESLTVVVPVQFFIDDQAMTMQREAKVTWIDQEAK